ncbi:hypothetical protein MGM1_1570 [Candidatus Malacoplasma girerdii]|uniref:Uncharacterized protein n=1 Tax=Candidatus Malacoplasma girerdii TaxID=1318617 RepID=A0A097SSI5_9BACT|nr:hypothetical protein MGM1_1570 [Candidatus Malacoplasma girerdii]ASJ89092.1 MAG: hypothetical protein B1217_0198 [Candidatus Malacoplasma girerdii]
MSIVNLKQTDYYLNKINFNPINNNQYIYLEGFDGTVTPGLTHWTFDFNIYLTQNLKLPAYVFQVNLTSSLGTIENIPLTWIQKTSLPDYVKNRKEVEEYKVHYVLDITNCGFFKNSHKNFYFPIGLNFLINTEVLNAAKLINSGDEVDRFINEFDNLKTSSYFYYTDKFNCEQDTNFQVDQEYKLVNNNSETSKSTNFQYLVNSNMVETREPIVNLMTLTSDEDFTIDGYELTFNYVIDNEIKTLKITNNETKFCSKINSFIFNKTTVFDSKTKEVKIIYGGQNGFYIPVKSQGYIELKAKILTKNNYAIFKANHAFSFAGNEESNLYQIKHFIINDLTNFKQIRI